MNIARQEGGAGLIVDLKPSSVCLFCAGDGASCIRDIRIPSTAAAAAAAAAVLEEWRSAVEVRAEI